jgi:hypothetical protein
MAQSIFIPRSNLARAAATIKVGVNGKFTTIPTGQTYVASDDEVAALQSAGVPLSETPFVVPAGTIVLPKGRYGAQLPIQINGKRQNLRTGDPITVSAEVLALLMQDAIEFMAADGLIVPPVITPPVGQYLLDRPFSVASQPIVAPDATEATITTGFNKMFAEAQFTGDVAFKMFLLSAQDRSGYSIGITAISAQFAAMVVRRPDGAERQFADNVNYLTNSNSPNAGPWKLRMEVDGSRLRVFKTRGESSGAIGGFAKIADFDITEGPDNWTFTDTDNTQRKIGNLAQSLLTSPVNRSAYARSVGMTNIRAGEYVPFEAPMTILQTTIDANYIPSFKVGYYGTQLNYLVRYERAGGEVAIPAVAVTVTDNAQAGTATMTGPAIPLSMQGVPLVARLMESKSGSITGVNQTAQILRPAPMTIGSNNVFGVLTFTNLAQGAYWQDYDFLSAGQRYINSKGDIQNAPANTDVRLRSIAEPVVSGGIHELSWVETPGNTTNVSTWNVIPTTYDDIQWTERTPVEFVNGRFRIRGKYALNPARSTDSGNLWLRGSGDFQDIRISEVGADFSRRIRQSYVDTVLKPLNGCIRTMEIQQINYVAQNYEWANRPRWSAGQGSYGSARTLDGFPHEMMIQMAEESNRPLSVIMGYFWPESTVKGFFRGLFLGEGMDIDPATGQPYKLTKGQRVRVSTVGNEPWNPSLTFLYQRLVEQGRITYPNQDENSQRIKVQVDRHKLVRRWILEAVPEFANRILFTWSGQPDNHAFEYFDIAVPHGLTGIDAVETSIYPGIGVKYKTYGNNTPAELYQPWYDDTMLQITSFQKSRAKYDAAGILRSVYEYGTDMFPNMGPVALSDAQKDAFLASPEFYNITVAGLRRIAGEIGGDVDLYYDTGDHRTWGHLQPRGLPSPKWQAVLQVLAEIKQANGG